MADREHLFEVSRRRAWAIAERLTAAGGEEARLNVTAQGYRVEVRLTRPAPDVPGVLAALALGDRWGHRHIPAVRNGGVARDDLWSEVHPGGDGGRAGGT
ncbi:hypothetical protein ACIQBJ_18435 [Kitasatospora sp. NPDC088391]|uniref:hypothetical protein n=1 Tax=Kitasatospora sp. NPDC088391 TaxID=3364074 RepID=UPI003808FF3E